MNNVILGLAAAGFAFVGATANAATPVLTAGQYASTGTVASNNGSANCGAVGLTQGAANDSVITFPGDGKAGFTLYVPLSGTIELCTGFGTVPAGGLNGFSATASCAITTLNGSIPAQPVKFSFTSTVTDKNSAIGTTTVAIPATDAVGGGCTATVNTTIVRTGK